MTKQEVLKRLRSEAKRNTWVVVTDRGEIWGSDASYSAIERGGGKAFILRADAVRQGDTYFETMGRAFDLEDIMEVVNEGEEN